MPVWVSFSCRDERHISDGTRLVEVIAMLEEVPQIVAAGINCTAPQYIPTLVREARSATRKPIVVYPNSGERYDIQTRRWVGESPPLSFAQKSRSWRAAGADLVGGCCRTGPQHIAQMRAALVNATFTGQSSTQAE